MIEENKAISSISDAPGRRFTLRKEEKLRHRSLVERLFSEGRSVYAYPLRVVWQTYSPEQLERNFRTGVPPRVGQIQMLITVPKKKLRHAVDRVLMRRRIREAYRLERLALKERVEGAEEMRLLDMAFVYIATTNEDFQTVRSRMRKLLAKIENSLFPPES